MSFVFTERINNSGYADSKYWFLVLPLGFLLTQYTITGYDASAHLSEETQGAANEAARGIWQSIFYSAIGGWIILLSFLFAVQDPQQVTDAGGFVGAIFTSAAVQRLGGHRAAHRDRGAVLLHHLLPDVVLADDVRVQP